MADKGRNDTTKSACFVGEQKSEIRTMPVEIVISAPRIHPWILKLPGSQVLTSINTTHWGLKVGPSYHDLKMIGLFQTKPDVVFSSTIATRDEREMSKSIFIGRTHFTNEEIKDFAKHRLNHAPWYQFWFDNCQGFAVNHLARHIVCLRCSNDAPDISRNAQLSAMLEVASLRPIEFFNLIGMILAVLVDRWFNLNLAAIGSAKAYYYTVLRLACASWLFLMGLYRTHQAHTEKEEEEVVFGNSVRASHYENIGSEVTEVTGAPESEDNSHKDLRTQACIRTRETHSNTVSEDAINFDRSLSPTVDETQQGTNRVTLTESLLSSRILIFAAVLGWNYKHLQVQNKLGQTIICTILIILLMFLSSYGKDSRLRFPYVQPDRKGRSMIHGPCHTCSAFSHRLFLNTRNCVQAKDGFPSNIPVRRSDRTLLPESPWLSEDTSYLWLRATVFLTVHLLVYENKPFLNYFAQQWLFQYLLNPFSPVTPWGNFTRESIYHGSLFWNAGIIGLFSLI